jgi:hypothetical protein
MDCGRGRANAGCWYMSGSEASQKLGCRLIGIWLLNRYEAQGVLSFSEAAERAGLADFDDSGHFYNWGFFLSLCKSSGLSMNCVGAREPLTVLVKQSHLPVMVFSPSVFLE